MRTSETTASARASRRFLLGEQQRFMLLLITPAALLLLLFQIVPIVIGANASFRDWALYNPKKIWVGLAHYKARHVGSGFPAGRAPQHLRIYDPERRRLSHRWHGAGPSFEPDFRWAEAVQTILLVPLMVAPVIAAIMMRWMFNDQFGIVNVVLEAIGLEGRPWLVERWSAFAIIVLTDIWLWTPWFTLLLLAGLQSLPKEPFEAAEIDGTTAWRTFTHLTLPMLRPVIEVCVVIRARCLRSGGRCRPFPGAPTGCTSAVM